MIVTVDLVVVVAICVGLSRIVVPGVAVPMRVRLAAMVVRMGVVQMIGSNMRLRDRGRTAHPSRESDA